MKVLTVAILGLVVFMFLTNPTDLPSVILVVPFILCYIIAFLSIRLLLGKLGGGIRTGASALLAGLVVVLLALQSLGQLTARDTVMVILLFGVAFLYIKRKTKVSV